MAFQIKLPEKLKNIKLPEKSGKKFTWAAFDAAYAGFQSHAGKLIQVALRAVELLAVLLTLVVLLLMLVLDVGHLIFGAESYPDLDGFLHAMLTVVVGLEFVHTILNPIPACILDVLIAAIARHFILGREEPVTCIVCVVSIAALLAIRRFLLPKEVRKTPEPAPESPIEKAQPAEKPMPGEPAVEQTPDIAEEVEAPAPAEEPSASEEEPAAEAEPLP